MNRPPIKHPAIRVPSDAEVTANQKNIQEVVGTSTTDILPTYKAVAALLAALPKAEAGLTAIEVYKKFTGGGSLYNAIMRSGDHNADVAYVQAWTYGMSPGELAAWLLEHNPRDGSEPTPAPTPAPAPGPNPELAKANAEIDRLALENRNLRAFITEKGLVYDGTEDGFGGDGHTA